MNREDYEQWDRIEGKLDLVLEAIYGEETTEIEGINESNDYFIEPTNEEKEKKSEEETKKYEDIILEKMKKEESEYAQ